MTRNQKKMLAGLAKIVGGAAAGGLGTAAASKAIKGDVSNNLLLAGILAGALGGSAAHFGQKELRNLRQFVSPTPGEATWPLIYGSGPIAGVLAAKHFNRVPDVKKQMLSELFEDISDPSKTIKAPLWKSFMGEADIPGSKDIADRAAALKRISAGGRSRLGRAAPYLIAGPVAMGLLSKLLTGSVVPPLTPFRETLEGLGILD